MAQVGLKNLHYAKMTIGTDGTETYGTPKKIGAAVSVDIQPSSNTAILYGDDAAVATDIKVTNYTVTIQSTDIPLEDQAILLGQTYSNGTLKANMSDAAPYVALLFESRKHDNGIRCVKLFKGKFAEAQQTINTRGENTEFQMPSLTATFVANADGDLKEIKDFEDGAATTSWYSSVKDSD